MCIFKALFCSHRDDHNSYSIKVVLIVKRLQLGIEMKIKSKDNNVIDEGLIKKKKVFVVINIK